MRAQHPAPAAAIRAPSALTASGLAHPPRAVQTRPPQLQRPSSKETQPGRDQITLVRRSSAQGRKGELQFFLQRIAGGLYVEREETPRLGIGTHLALCFIDRVSFERWCDDDAVRFEDPRLHQCLKRDGEALWQIEA